MNMDDSTGNQSVSENSENFTTIKLENVELRVEHDAINATITIRLFFSGRGKDDNIQEFKAVHTLTHINSVIDAYDHISKNHVQFPINRAELYLTVQRNHE